MADRLLDGSESDVDCGGTCRTYEAGARCNTAADCETTTCDAGRCGPPSCTNGVRDGLETDIDCGGGGVAGVGTGCLPCAIDKRCYDDGDCVTGECGEPSIPEDPWDCWGGGWWPTEDTCYPRP